MRVLDVAEVEYVSGGNKKSAPSRPKCPPKGRPSGCPPHGKAHGPSKGKGRGC